MYAAYCRVVFCKVSTQPGSSIRAFLPSFDIGVILGIMSGEQVRRHWSPILTG